MLLGGSVGLLAACQRGGGAPSGGAATVAGQKPSGWDELVEAAKREGTVTVYATDSVNRPALIDAFQRAYPSIRVEGTFATGGEQAQRMLTERQVGKYLVDVSVGGTNTPFNVLKPAGVLAPLPPVLTLPEVVEPSGWLGNKLWWADGAEPLTVLMFQGAVQSAVAYNTQMVDPSQFRSYRDLLDPKWRGKMVSTDIRRQGPGGVPARWIYLHKDLGPQFLDRLYSEQDITLSSDQRQMIDWLAQGRFPVGIFLFYTEVSRAADQGLPVALVPNEQFREGAVLGAGGGAVSLVDQAPHPNAAKLYINWLLSKQGQTEWQQATRENSLRIDIPKDGLYAASTPKVDHEYTNGAAEAYNVPAQVLEELISGALEKAKR
jgi:iron(III) transport system substrate-binding protein